MNNHNERPKLTLHNLSPIELNITICQQCAAIIIQQIWHEHAIQKNARWKTSQPNNTVHVTPFPTPDRPQTTDHPPRLPTRFFHLFHMTTGLGLKWQWHSPHLSLYVFIVLWLCMYIASNFLFFGFRGFWVIPPTVSSLFGSLSTVYNVFIYI